MHSSKLIRVLRHFDQATFQRFQIFIQHPYFVEVKQKQKVLALFDLLSLHYPDFNHVALQKEQVFSMLFPKELFSAKKVNKIMARLFKIIRRFIAHEFGDPQQKKVQELLAEAQFYQSQSLDAYFIQSIQQLQAHQKKIKQREKDFYYTEYLINRQVSEFDTLFNKRKEDLNLLSTHQSLDEFYLVAKLEYACWILAQKNSHVPLSVLESLQILDLNLSLIEEKYAAKVPSISLFYQVYLLLKNGDEEQTGNRLRVLLDQYADLLPFAQLVSLQAIYRSYCVREVNRGGQISLDYLFDLYREHLEKGYLFRRGGLQAGVIKNLVNAGLQLKAYDWVKQFLTTYRNRIVGTEYPQEVYYFNLANYYFALQKYDKVLDTLKWYEEDTYYKIAARRLELKVYYEQNSPILSSKMNAFKVYLFRISKKILPPLHRDGNNNFINFLKQICHSGTPYNDAKINSILSKINRSKATVEKEWLIEKLEALR